MEGSPFPAKYLQRLQRYTVSVYEHELKRLHARGCLNEAIPGVYVLKGEVTEDFYDGKLGLIPDGFRNDYII
ncbi:MAG: hypothetical protein LBS62_10635, partial [Clostridiales bacterium]|jgi:hypothetical protein|nr:hypothetical protein [Clostridiales bacterium]